MARNIIKLIVVLILFTNCDGLVIAQDSNDTISIIPIPASMEIRDGYFTLDSDTCIIANNSLQCYKELLRQYCRAELKDTKDTTKSNKIVFELDESLKHLGQEGYILDINTNAITINAYDHKGIFYGIQSLRQLLPTDVFSSSASENIPLKIPCAIITDKPQLQWRGLMIDCSRTFWSTEFLKRYIDLLALHKMNTLHLHLTDDQGWRLEIKSHPELTEKCATFAKKYNEPPERQGFYSQTEMKELIKYAAMRNVTIIPEIEMPGHSSEVFVAYPQLSCSGQRSEIFPFFKGPNITDQIFCAGNDATFEFLEDVLSEVADLFPSEFIHIGGDEAPKTAWKSCAKCQGIIKELDLKNEHELQSYFIKRIEKFLNSKGKRLIGWDEILEGGLAENATVMSWRGINGGIAAATSGHDAVMSPTSHCYFDYSYNSISTEKAYSYQPIPAQLTSAQQKHILGLQANFWSHIDRTEVAFDRQIFPRLCALAEVGWSPKETRNWQNFSQRLKPHLKRLEYLGVNYHHEISKGTVIGMWHPADMSETYKTLELDITEYLKQSGKYHVTFQYSQGLHRLGIKSVALLIDGKEISRDNHRGETGASHKDNIYKFEIDKQHNDVKYSIKAEIRSEGGCDSTGNIYLIHE
ncbi:MAG: family 20 glycosylhydrolase [Phycisphaerae bacterium]|nr:family 20 glycosylhydrolase [Phycisphaerae bacterium]